jgi:hypothetical protein
MCMRVSFCNQLLTYIWNQEIHASITQTCTYIYTHIFIHGTTFLLTVSHVYMPTNTVSTKIHIPVICVRGLGAEMAGEPHIDSL